MILTGTKGDVHNISCSAKIRHEGSELNSCSSCPTTTCYGQRQSGGLIDVS